MQKYYVWKDNLLEEYFSMEVQKFEKLYKFQDALKKEKIILHTIEADGLINAIKIHKESLKKIYSTNDDEQNLFLLNDIKKKPSLH